MFEKFIGQYQVSKTLRFELKPVGKTKENIETSGILDHDRKRDEEYERMKTILDLHHKALLERALSKVGADTIPDCWVKLAEKYEEFRSGTKDKSTRNDFENALKKVRKILVDAFKEDEMHDELTEATPSKLIKRLMKQGDSSDNGALETFNGFACYFKGYQENRKNIYSAEPQTTAAAYRAIDVNFPKFIDAVKAFEHIAAAYPQVVCEVESELSEKLKGRKLATIFCFESYGEFLSQSGIDFFNCVLGGYSSGAEEKKRGLNEFVNLERQRNNDAQGDGKLHRIAPLFKQILSDRDSESFRFSAFEKDEDVVAAVKGFARQLGDMEVVKRIKAKFGCVGKDEKIYIAGGSSLTAVSRNLCGSWSALESCMREAASAKYSVLKYEKKIADAVDKWMDSAVFALADLPDVTVADEKSPDGVKTYRIADCWRGEYAEKVFQAVESSTPALLAMPEKADDGADALQNDPKRIQTLKDYLDAVQDLLHLAKPLAVSAELDRDVDFYAEFDELYALLDEVVPLYNKVRNYVTKKIGEVEKIKLKFDCSTLADGWDLNKEQANRCVILIKDGRYYLGIMRPKCKIDFCAMETESEPTYGKMVYKYLPGPNKMLPKVVFSEKGRAKYKPDRELLDKYSRGCHIKSSPSFDVGFCRRLIDFFKDAIGKNDDWSVFDFKFSPTESYAGIDGFYKEVEAQGYNLGVVNVSAKAVDELVERGDLFMFQIYNKDFAEGAVGKANLHTIYWNAVFCAENLAKPVIKLGGGAELFYRQTVINKPYSHEIGEKMVNRWTKSGDPIPEKAFGEIFAFVNGKMPESQLGAEAKALLAGGQLSVKPVKHRIIKDARYAREGFFLHVPITFNAFSGDAYRFNDSVNAAVVANENLHIIGLDRGERHLIYLTMINRAGEIVLQKSFNTLTGATYDGHVRTVDYQKKLAVMERGRDAARKSWSEIGSIKDLKAGYISLVVHEIVSLMRKYDAIVVMEDLNFGFKRGRFKVERQVYQKFEKALIDKLNYLVFKDAKADDAGGVLRGYQLTAKLESFEKLGKQTGFVYYVPAGYTSKIDPTTGFTNLFNTKKCTSAAGILEFFSKFDAIVYDGKMKSFAFRFDYSNFKVSQTSHKKDWTVYSADRRLIFDTKAREESEIFPTKMIVDVLEKAGEKVCDGYDLKAFLANVEPTKANAPLLHELFKAFDRTMQMRNSRAATGEDYISSPVMNSSGKFFDSRESKGSLPENADANGAYHIALKGLYLVKNRLGQGKPDLKITHEQWFEFAQTR